MNANEVVIVEDNKTMLLGMAETLKREKLRVHPFDNAESALAFMAGHPVGLVITDLKMEPMDGLAFLREVKQTWPRTEALMVSAYGTVEKAVEAMQIGAADFITKPFSPEELRMRVGKLTEKIRQTEQLDRLQEENRLLQRDIDAPFENMVGSSPAMQETFALVERVAAGNSSVLIQGESGTGKELIARAIHRQSPRAKRPFVKVNCAALNENLLESELFGHEKGAFTGAVKLKKGRFELADGGSLLLDEIGDMPVQLQTRLLRVLQENELERVGGEQTIRVDVRFIFSTHQDLEKLIAAGRFRQDLYYRLNVFPITLPPVRERREDIPLLVRHFAERCRQTRFDPPKQVSEAGMRLLCDYAWPGNVRELENIVERLMVLAPGAEIDAGLVAQHLGQEKAPASSYSGLPLEEAMYAFEKDLIIAALEAANGAKSRAARLLGLNTSTLYYKMEKFGLRDKS